MKYIADLLTALRFIAALVTAIAAFSGAWTLALVAFIVGILSDALDGPMARRWPYTAEESARMWWRQRKDPHAWDNNADLVLSTCGLLSVTFGLFDFWPAFFAFIGVALLSGCFLLALEIAARSSRPKLAECIDVAHGWVFGLELMAMLIIMTAQVTSDWQVWAIAYLALGSMIVITKWDRATSRLEVDYSR